MTVRLREVNVLCCFPHRPSVALRAEFVSCREPTSIRSRLSAVSTVPQRI